MSGLSKIAAERNQKLLLELAVQPGNGKSPQQRLTSFNIVYQISAPTAKLGIQDGHLIILAYSFGAPPSHCHSNLDILIFFCSMNCASIHRKIGTHITKVYACFHSTLTQFFSLAFRKSLTMDSWTKEQVEVCTMILHKKSC
jgi:hypothetical protein